MSGGTLVVANQGALADSTVVGNSGSVVFDSSVTGHEFTFGGLSGSIDLALQDDASSPNAVGLTVGGDNADTIFSGVLSGGALTKVGTGGFELTGANSYGGRRRQRRHAHLCGRRPRQHGQRCLQRRGVAVVRFQR